jgi:hypothetical protein
MIPLTIGLLRGMVLPDCHWKNVCEIGFARHLRCLGLVLNQRADLAPGGFAPRMSSSLWQISSAQRAASE